MAKNKEDSDHMKVGAELRAAMVVKKKEKQVEPRAAFRKFFIRVKDKLKLSPDMENVLWKHLVATKNDKPDSFENGLKNFGLIK